MISVPSGFECGQTGSSNGTSHFNSLQCFVTTYVKYFLNFFCPTAENFSVLNWMHLHYSLPGFWSRTFYLCRPLTFQLHPSRSAVIKINLTIGTGLLNLQMVRKTCPCQSMIQTAGVAFISPELYFEAILLMLPLEVLQVFISPFLLIADA